MTDKAEQTKVIWMGRGGTPYIRVPDNIDPSLAVVTSAARIAELEASRSSHRRLLVAVNRMKNARPGGEYLCTKANLLLLTSVQLNEQQQ